MNTILSFLLKAIDIKGLLSIFATFSSFMVIGGMQTAIILVILIVLHEIGHAIALYKMGYPIPKIFLIPFLGGVSIYKGKNVKPIHRAWFAFGGPAFGALTTTIGFIIFLMTKNEFWFYFSFFGFILNLINLIPLSIVDGGKIVSILDRRFYFIGLILGIIASIKYPSIILTILIILTIVQLFKEYQKDISITQCINCGQKNRIKQSDKIESIAKCGKCQFELNASYEQKFILAISYFGLIIFQIIMIITLLPYKN
jgi:Zn-dependent protease